MHEPMGRYQDVYQFKPNGPHRDLMHQLLDPLKERCPACRGRSIVTEPRIPEGCFPCTRYEGIGSLWLVGQEAVQASRAEVLKSITTRERRRCRSS